MLDSGQPAKLLTFVALDRLKIAPAMDLGALLGDRVDGCKVHTLIMRSGAAQIIPPLKKKFRLVFADMKLHDTPDTVAEQVKILVDADADFITVHAQGGVKMIKAAKQAAGKTKILVVTLLTSLTRPMVVRISNGTRERVLADLVQVGAEGGADGFICSVWDIKEVRANLINPENYFIICPNIRLPGQSSDGHDKVATPQEARKGRANAIVLGRHVVEDPDPVAALESFIQNAYQTT